MGKGAGWELGPGGSEPPVGRQGSESGERVQGLDNLLVVGMRWGRLSLSFPESQIFLQIPGDSRSLPQKHGHNTKHTATRPPQTVTCLSHPLSSFLLSPKPSLRPSSNPTSSRKSVMRPCPLPNPHQWLLPQSGCSLVPRRTGQERVPSQGTQNPHCGLEGGRRRGVSTGLIPPPTPAPAPVLGLLPGSSGGARSGQPSS